MGQVLQNQIANPRSASIPSLPNPNIYRQSISATITKSSATSSIKIPDGENRIPTLPVPSSSSAPPVQCPIVSPQTQVATESTVSTISHREVMSKVQEEINIPRRPQLQPFSINMSNCSNCNINFKLAK